MTAVITSFKDKGLVLNCVESVLNCGYPELEIIVVDCLSTSLPEILTRKFGSKVKVIQFNRDVGVAEQRNLGLKNSCENGKYVLFLDNDTELAKGAVDRLVEVAEKNPSDSIFQPRIASLHDRNKTLEIGLFSNLFGVPKPVRKVGAEPFFASGCGMLVRKNLFNAVGGFDPILHFGAEELDLTWRARLFGYTIKPVPEAIIYHKMEGTMMRLSAQRLYFGLRNTIRMLLKNYGFPLNFFVTFSFPLMVMVEGFIMCFVSHFSIRFKRNIASLAITQNRTPRLMIMFILALGWNLKKLKDTIREHRRIQKFRVISDGEILRKMKKNDLLFVSASYQHVFKEKRSL